MATSDAPISFSTITLVVNDLEKVATFYQSIMGLSVLSKNGPTCTMGQADTELLHLREDRNARVCQREAGLFHTAFLLPNRANLASWLKHTTRGVFDFRSRATPDANWICPDNYSYQ